MENNIDHLNEDEKKTGLGFIFLWVGVVIVALVAIKLFIFPELR